MQSFEWFQNTAAFSLQFKQRKTLYWVVLLAIAGGFASLPFVSVPLSFQSRGQIASQFPNNALISSVSAPVLYVNLEENKVVTKGDTILVLDASKLEEEKQLALAKLSETKQMIVDLEVLAKKGNFSKLVSGLYLQKKKEYNQKLKGLKTRLAYHKRELATTQSLYKKGVVAQKEVLFQKKQYE